MLALAITKITIHVVTFSWNYMFNLINWLHGHHASQVLNRHYFEHYMYTCMYNLAPQKANNHLAVVSLHFGIFYHTFCKGNNTDQVHRSILNILLSCIFQTWHSQQLLQQWKVATKQVFRLRFIITIDRINVRIMSIYKYVVFSPNRAHYKLAWAFLL
jgi:hypothetical protein